MNLRIMPLMIVCFAILAHCLTAAAAELPAGVDVPVGYAVHGILAGEDGSLYVTGGHVIPPEARTKSATSRHAADGTRLWEATQRDVQFPGEDHNNLVGKELLLDAAGNLYVIAATDCYAAFHRGFTIIKYDNAGTLLWVRYCSFPNYGFTPPHEAGIDPDGTIYVATYMVNYGEGPSPVAAVVKYDPQGELTMTLPLPDLLASGLNGSNDGHRLGLAVDSAGNVYVAGPNGIAKFDPAGNEIWTTVPVPPASFGSEVAITLDRSGNLFITGSGGTSKYSASGSLLWSNAAATGSALATDASGNLTVTGGSGTRTYDPLGKLISQLDANATAVTAAPGGTLYLLTDKGIRRHSIN